MISVFVVLWVLGSTTNAVSAVRTLDFLLFPRTLIGFRFIGPMVVRWSSRPISNRLLLRAYLMRRPVLLLLEFPCHTAMRIPNGEEIFKGMGRKKLVRLEIIAKVINSINSLLRIYLGEIK